VLCEALLILGRIVRNHDTDAARSMFAEAAAVAIGAGLSRWHLRAQQESALEDWMLRGAAPMEETRALAASYGAHVTVAVMDLSLADFALSAFDAEACLRHAAACVDASRRFGLATEPVANLWLAGAHALRRDDDAMYAAIDASRERDPDDPRILADLYGRVLLTRALVRDELEDLRPLTDVMIGHVRRAPATQSVYPGRITWALLSTIDDDDHGASARGELAEFVDRFDFPMFRSGAHLIEAVALGRAGEPAAAATLALEAYEAPAASPQRGGQFHSMAMLVAGAAIRDGWGDPERWLRAAEAFFTQRSFDLLARRCRSLLSDAGAAVPRRRGTSEVPETLRALGVTGREVDVLRLVVAGCTNKEIAAELVLSPKTVERHLSNLFGRLAVGDRHALADVGGRHLP
jgi:DNA-binding CsgD family transcriptional regulator